MHNKRLAGLILAAIFATNSSAIADTVPFSFPSESQSSSAPTVCAFKNYKITPSTKIYVAGAYQGQQLNYQIDQSGHQASSIKVAVNSADAPVVLMLGAYEPTVWSVGWSEGTKINAVLVSGYHRQVIAGLPKETPIINSTSKNAGPCSYFYVGNDQLTKINPIAKQLFGRDADMVFTAQEGNVVVGNDLLSATKLLTSSDTKPDSFIDKGAPLAGEAGLRDAVAKGIIRPAKEEDIEAWKKKFTESLNLPPIKEAAVLENFHIHNPYVVEKAFAIPAGLFGANSATFFISENAPQPTGNPGHSQIFYLKDGRCSGSTCSMMGFNR